MRRNMLLTLALWATLLSTFVIGAALRRDASAPFDYAATAASPPKRLGVFGAWTATRTARVEGERFNCQADTGPLDPPAPGAHPWARARLAVYDFPGEGGGSVAVFWDRRMIPRGAQARLDAGGESVALDGRGGPVRLAQDRPALLALLERVAEADPDAVVTVTAPAGPGEADTEERFSLRGFREARAAIRRECARPAESPDWLVLDAGLVRFGIGWNVHAVPTETPGRRTCFAAARRLLRPPDFPDPAGPRLVIARLATAPGGAILGYDPAHAYAEGAVAVLQVGEQRFPMPVRAGIAEPRDGGAAVHAMLEADPAGVVTVTGPGDGGGEVTNRFSLDGFRWTYEALPTYCDGP